MSERESSQSPSVKMREGRGGFVFDMTPAVAASRQRSHYIDCPVCQADHAQYLFHRTGVRFVRCSNCGLVYVNPATRVGPNWFDIARFGQVEKDEDRALIAEDTSELVRRFARDFERVEGRPLRKAVLLGRYLDELRTTAVARELDLDVVPVSDTEFQELTADSRVDWVKPHLGPDVDLLILNETLEACSDPNAVLQQLTGALSAKAWIGVTYSNSQSLPAALLRRYWPSFFDFKTAFYNTSNLAALMSRYGFVLTSQGPVKQHHTLDYVLARIAKNRESAKVLKAALPSSTKLSVRTGAQAATFRRRAKSTEEKLSIIFPCFNEETYVADVLEALLAKKLKIPKEVIIVESNSTDRTREVVQRFAGHPEVKLLLEDKPRGKGHAVRTGLAAATGSIILIQDADFEYDLDDYDALLEPILQRRTSFVLGSRSLGLDDWKVRRFAQNHVKELMLNFAQLVFAETFNVLYQKRTTDINTMFKVFRAECLEGFELTGDRFELDIELVCKLVKNGNSPIEVPVNYVARGFEEGKKISFLKDALPSYWAIFKNRL